MQRRTKWHRTLITRYLEDNRRAFLAHEPLLPLGEFLEKRLIMGRWQVPHLAELRARVARSEAKIDYQSPHYASWLTAYAL